MTHAAAARRSLNGLINDAATKAEEEAKLAHADETGTHLKTIAMLRERLARERVGIERRRRGEHDKDRPRYCRRCSIRR